MANLAPDRFFDRISAIDVHADLLDRGLTCALLDIDNTIRSRADRMVPPDVRAWLDGTREAGVDLCLLSNNYHKNVPELAAELNLPYIYKALKPLPFGYRAAMRKMHAESRNTVVIGDQLGTDILGARLLGLHAYLVAPLASQDARYALLFRKMEQRLIRRTKERSGAGNAEPEGAPAFARSERSREESQ
jgi:HAD superfamily phosphatase (TIGR01668 family)